MKRKNVDKMELALSSARHMTKDAMTGRFDWEDQMEEIVERIKSWNA